MKRYYVREEIDPFTALFGGAINATPIICPTCGKKGVWRDCKFCWCCGTQNPWFDEVEFPDTDRQKEECANGHPGLKSDIAKEPGLFEDFYESTPFCLHCGKRFFEPSVNRTIF